MKRQLYALVKSGLIRKQFVQGANAATMRSLHHFAAIFAEDRGAYPLKRSIGALMIAHEVLTPQMVENVIVAHHYTQLWKWANRLAMTASPEFDRLVAGRQLSQPVAMMFLNMHENWFEYDYRLQRLADILTPDSGNIVNWGITKVIEFEAVQTCTRRHHTRRDEFYHEKNNLLKLARATEQLDEKREQVAAVIAADDIRSFPEQMQDVWQHYAAQSDIFNKIAREKPIPADVRSQNVAVVNGWQGFYLRRAIDSPDQRFLDIYGRYNHAEMDPFMLAIVARTAGWYIDSNYSQLFTAIRLVPDRHGTHPKMLDALAWAALAFYPKMKILRGEGKDFTGSLSGANRMFLTHSNANEAAQRGSIPIIGLATWKNTEKIDRRATYALLAADFDRGDDARYENRHWGYYDLSALISFVIGQTLQALREVETLEIARAKDIPLVRGSNGRWRPRRQPKENKVEATRGNFAGVLSGITARLTQS